MRRRPFAPSVALFALFALVAGGCGGGGQQVKRVSGSCDLRQPDVCRDLAQRAESGVDGRPDPARASELYLQAASGYTEKCEADEGLACAQLAELYRHGRGVVQNPNEAARLDAQACNLGVSRACR